MFEIGASLREARLKRGLSPADVQKAIRIRDRYLQALEDERWELLPGDAYVKGFLRTYADFLGLDANLYVDEYNSRVPHHEELSLAPQPMRRAQPVSRGHGRRRLLGVVAVLAVVAGIAGWQLSGSSSGGKSAHPPTTTTTTRPATTRKKSSKPKRPPVALPTRAALVASRGDCWLQVRKGNAAGAVIYENTLLQGHTLRLNLASGPLWIRVGRAPSLDVRLGGKLVHGLPAQTGNVLLTRHGLQPA